MPRESKIVEGARQAVLFAKLDRLSELIAETYQIAGRRLKGVHAVPVLDALAEMQQLADSAREYVGTKHIVRAPAAKR